MCAFLLLTPRRLQRRVFLSAVLEIDIGTLVAVVVAHDKAGMRRGALYLGLGVSPAEYALLASGTAFCEDVGPFQSSKTKAALAAFFLGAHTRLTQGGGKRRPFIAGPDRVALARRELLIISLRRVLKAARYSRDAIAQAHCGHCRRWSSVW